MIMLLQLLFSYSLAKDLPGEELYVAPNTEQHRDGLDGSPAAHGRPSRGQSGPSTSTSPRHPTPSPTKTSTGGETGSNLPLHYFNGSRRQSTASELILPPKGSIDILRALKVGDKVEAKINHSIIAFPDEKAPVVAETKNHIKLIGESRLEKNSHRIFIDFSRAVQNGKVYNLKASALTNLGQPGFEGEYHSRELEYFSADFLSSFVAGYFDGLIPRHRNAFGQLEEDSNIDAAVKKGLASGSMSSAERFREKLKKTPEFSELLGPLDLQILILDQPQTQNY